MKISIILLFSVFLTFSSFASFMIELGSNFTTDEDNVSQFKFDKMDNRAFLGASLDSKNAFYFGQSVIMYSREASLSGTKADISTTEIGPRFMFFFDDASQIHLSAAWHPYAKGSKTVSGTKYDVSGSSYMATFGYQLKLTRAFYLGASINYHSLSISKQTDPSNNETDVSHTYTTLYPFIDLSIRFR